MKGQDKIVVQKLVKISIISAAFMAIQLFGGYYAHSIAIFADAFHLLSDVLAYVISLAAVLMSIKKSPKYLTFGFQKIQPFGALVNVAIIWFVTIELFIQATQRLFHQSIVEEPLIMLGTSIFGLLCNLYIMQVLHSDEHAGGHHNCSHSHSQPSSQALTDEIVNKHEYHDSHSSCNHGHAHKSKKLEHKEQHHHNCSHQHQHEHHQNEHPQHTHQEHTHQKHEHQQSKHQKAHSHQHLQILNEHQHDHQHQHSLQLQQIICNPHDQECTNHLKQHNHTANSLLKDDIGLNSTASDEQIKLRQKHSSKRFHNNINIEAAYIHILTDIILSIGVIISASIIYFFAPEGHIWTYWQIADPVCTYLFSFMAIYSTIPIIKESMVFLLDGCDDQQMVLEIQEELKESLIVEKVECLRVWSTNRGKYYGTLRVRTKRGSRRDLHRIFSSRNIEGFVHFVQEQEPLDTHQ